MPGVLNLRPIVEGVAYRSSAPFGWDAEAVARFLGRHGIQSVVDLRSPAESNLVPWLLEARAHGEPLPELVSAPLDPTDGIPGESRTLETPADLADLYLWWTESSPGMVVRALRPIATGRRTLLHCAAGKDRAGVVSAIVHLLAGTPAEDIVADYVRTNTDLPAIIEVLRGLYLTTHPDALLPAYAADNPPVILTAPEATMELFLLRFGQRNGTARDYLRLAGMPARELDALERLLRRS
jgi:protein-tyrosine phosphatase